MSLRSRIEKEQREAGKPNSNVINALKYIVNCGGNATMMSFDDDHAPVGTMLRQDIKDYFTYRDGKMLLNELGQKVLKEASDAE